MTSLGIVYYIYVYIYIYTQYRAIEQRISLHNIIDNRSDSVLGLCHFQVFRHECSGWKLIGTTAILRAKCVCVCVTYMYIACMYKNMQLCKYLCIYVTGCIRMHMMTHSRTFMTVCTYL